MRFEPNRRKAESQIFDLLLGKPQKNAAEATIKEYARLAPLAERLSKCDVLQDQLETLSVVRPETPLAHYIASYWWNEGTEEQSWQLWNQAPRAIRFSIDEQRAAYQELHRAAVVLIKALSNPAINAAKLKAQLGETYVTAMRNPPPAILGSTSAEVGPQVDVPSLRKIELFDTQTHTDNLLRRLLFATSDPCLAHGGELIGKRRRVGARETFFARSLAKVFRYSSRTANRSRIEALIASLITELASWEGSTKTWHEEWVRQCLRYSSVKRTSSVARKK